MVPLLSSSDCDSVGRSVSSIMMMISMRWLWWRTLSIVFVVVGVKNYSRSLLFKEAFRTIVKSHLFWFFHRICVRVHLCWMFSLAQVNLLCNADLWDLFSQLTPRPPLTCLFTVDQHPTNNPLSFVLLIFSDLARRVVIVWYWHQSEEIDVVSCRRGENHCITQGTKRRAQSRSERERGQRSSSNSSRRRTLIIIRISGEEQHQQQHVGQGD